MLILMIPLHIKSDQPRTIRVKLSAWFCSSADLCRLWSKMTPGRSLKMAPRTGLEIIFTDTEPCDYHLVVQRANDAQQPPLMKTIMLQMETWATFGPPGDYFYLGSYDRVPHVAEWHLAQDCDELLQCSPAKSKGDAISVILSDICSNEIYRHRIAFAHLLDDHFEVDKYGADADAAKGEPAWRNYRGRLPPHTKDEGLMPYKYTFNAENAVVHNYVTEKLYDGILSECLVFYMGAPNAAAIVDSRAFVQLPVGDMAGALAIVRRSVADNEYEARLPFIHAEKARIVRTMSPLAVCCREVLKAERIYE